MEIEEKHKFQIKNFQSITNKLFKLHQLLSRLNTLEKLAFKKDKCNILNF